MSKYTVSIAEMLSAYTGSLNVYENEDTVEIRDPLSNQSLTFDVADFNYFKLSNPNFVIKNFASMWLRSKLSEIPNKFTDTDEINDAIIDKFLETFVRHFYEYEISRENPLAWFVSLEAFFQEHMPFWIMAYQKLMIENLQWTTREGESTGNANANANSTSNSKDNNVSASADVPQNDLEFQFQSAKPEETYCFAYSTVVNGAKGENDTTSRTTSDQTTKATSKGRDYTIAQLVNQLQGYSNGIYLEMWQRALSHGLFMTVF